MVRDSPRQRGPFLFAAWVQTQPPPTCRHWFPWASISLYTLSQLILAVTIGLGTITPVVGIAICVVWLACGLTLIAAQTLAEHRGGDHR